MVSSDLLTGEQGIRIMVESLLFFIFYFIYLKVVKEDTTYFTDLIITTIIFVLWSLSVAITSNLVLAFAIHFPRHATIHSI